MVNIKVQDHFTALVLCVNDVPPYLVEPKIVPENVLADEYLFALLFFSLWLFLVVVFQKEVWLVSVHLVELKRGCRDKFSISLIGLSEDTIFALRISFHLGNLFELIVEFIFDNLIDSFLTDLLFGLDDIL